MSPRHPRTRDKVAGLTVSVVMILTTLLPAVLQARPRAAQARHHMTAESIVPSLRIDAGIAFWRVHG